LALPLLILWTMKLRKLAIFITVITTLIAGAWYLNPWRSITHPPGVLVREAPIQKPTAAVPLAGVGGWKFMPVADYQISGRVLGTKRYYSGFGSDIVPLDVAIGWGRMSDQAVLDQFELSMSNRFFFYKWQNTPPIPEDEIMRSASNNHIIAANSKVRKTINSLIPGHIVTLGGYLVNATGPNGTSWNTSVRRNDTGNGACEVFYVIEAFSSKTPPTEKTAVVAAK
jgi:hypothetical protein